MKLMILLNLLKGIHLAIVTRDIEIYIWNRTEVKIHANFVQYTS
jgi:hypothetical protein